MSRPVLSAVSTLTLALALGAVVPGCGDSNSGGIVVSGPPPSRVLVTPVAPSILQGETVQLTAQVVDENGDTVVGARVTWESSDASVASVSSSGLVTGESPGGARVTATATSGGVDVSGNSLVTVESPGPS
jgi:hypothetical protein